MRPVTHPLHVVRATLPRGALAACVLTATFACTPAGRSAPAPMPVAATTAATSRPIPYPVLETAAFRRAVERGTRTRTGEPGPRNWTQYARYALRAELDPASKRLTGEARIRYQNRSP